MPSFPGAYDTVAKREPDYFNSVPANDPFHDEQVWIGKVLAEYRKLHGEEWQWNFKAESLDAVQPMLVAPSEQQARIVHAILTRLVGYDEAVMAGQEAPDTGNPHQTLELYKLQRQRSV